MNNIIVKSAPITPRVSRAPLKCWDMSSSGTCNGNRRRQRMVPAKVKPVQLKGPLLFADESLRSPTLAASKGNGSGFAFARLVSGEHHGFATASGLFASICWVGQNSSTLAIRFALAAFGLSRGQDWRRLGILVKLYLYDVLRETLNPIKSKLLVSERTSKGDSGAFLPATQFSLQFTDCDNCRLGSRGGYVVHLDALHRPPLTTTAQVVLRSTLREQKPAGVRRHEHERYEGNRRRSVPTRQRWKGSQTISRTRTIPEAI